MQMFCNHQNKSNNKKQTCIHNLQRISYRIIETKKRTKLYLNHAECEESESEKSRSSGLSCFTLR